MELRRSTKLAGVVVAAVLACGTIGASAAEAGPAPDWKVEEFWLGAGNTKNISAKSSEITRLYVLGLGGLKLIWFESPKAECSIVGKIEGNAMWMSGSKKGLVMFCEKVTVQGVATCTVNSPGQPLGTVAFNSLKSTLVWTNGAGQAAADLIAPETGAVLAELVVGGAMCPKGLGGKTYPVKGQIITPITPVAASAKSLTQTFPEPAISSWWNNAEPREEETITQLTVGASAATLKTAFGVPLSPIEELFGVFPG